jgi:hypothetical protein
VRRKSRAGAPFERSGIACIIIMIMIIGVTPLFDQPPS